MGTPADDQYQKLKKQYEGAILLFRMGDFYEVFDEDAHTLSKAIGLTLTSRSKGENKRPMAGIPHHALPQYLGKIVKLGFKVAIAEQMEDPKTAKGVVKRDVVRVVTSGSLIDDRNLDESQSAYIVSLVLDNNVYGIAILDLSTAEFKFSEFSKSNNIKSEVVSFIKRFSPKEIVIDESLKNDFGMEFEIPKKYIDKYSKDYELNRKRLLELFGTTNLKGFGLENYASATIAAGIIIDYLSKEQKWDLTHIKKISEFTRSKYMNMDVNTIRNLELVNPLSDSSTLSLVKILDNTKTAMGKRLIRKTLMLPFVNKEDIEERYEIVDKFSKEEDKLNFVREKLNNVFDIERITARIGLTTINPRDFLALSDSLQNISSLLQVNNIELITKLKKYKTEIEQMINLIDSSISENSTVDINQGGIFNEHYNSQIDELREIKGGGHDFLAKLQQKEIERTGITNLKIRFNNVFGFYIEVTNSYKEKVPNNYIRKQTLVNAERFITEELKLMEEKILSAEGKLFDLEKNLFIAFKSSFLTHIDTLQEISNIIAELDLLSTFAFNALSFNYVRPQIVEGTNVLDIQKGRHPIVERNLSIQFTSNDVNLNNEKFIVILTGPNMSGKSTYIRQIATIVLMAQIGSFVPADSMTFSIVDRVFSRIGASDNLSRAESTFMVEMNETANILNNATSKSFVILDEVGRGTSTYDGVAIAYSVVLYILEKLKCNTLFATHYNELTTLSSKYSEIKNSKVKILEEAGDVVFLHEIVDGASEKSFGVHVARLAGLPKEVIENANKVLKDFEGQKENKVAKTVNKRSNITPHIPQITLGI